MALEPASSSFGYADSFTATNELEAYERLLHDVLPGDPTLFNDAAGIERLWEEVFSSTLRSTVSGGGFR